MHNSFSFTAPEKYFLKKFPELLFVQYDKDNRNTPVHAHDFWQMEIVVSGDMKVKSPEKKIKSVVNDCILIPPGIPHCIVFGKESQSSWSIKFKLEVNRLPSDIILLKRFPESMDIRSNILQALKSFNNSSKSYIILQNLLGTLIELEFQQGMTGDSSAIVSQIKELINTYEGRQVTINELADKLNCSRNNISKKFHQETGIQLKTFIDSCRVEIASRMLLYSNQKIITIAEIMGFRDVYSFSRFFRRIQGCSPRQYRVQHKSELSIPNEA